MVIEPVRQDGLLQYGITIFDMMEADFHKNSLQPITDLGSIIQSVPDTVLRIQLSGRILFANHAFGSMKPRDLIGTSLFKCFDIGQRERLNQTIHRTIALGIPQTCQISGSFYTPGAWYSLTFGTVHSDTHMHASSSYMTVVIREISDHKFAERLIQESRERLRDLSAKLESVREEERKRLAREIHDEFGQALTALSLDLAWLLKRIVSSDKISRKKVREMIRLSTSLIGGVRKLASELRPSILDDLGLIPAIEWQLSEFRKRTGIRTSLRCSKEGIEIGNDEATAAFRVIQEALTNVIRHARASRVDVSVMSDQGALLMSIIDDGRGISERQIAKPSALGLIGMAERIRRLGGEFKIGAKAAGGGTRVDVFLPLHHRARKENIR
jgi:signal transduction histidine kinase